MDVVCGHACCDGGLTTVLDDLDKLPMFASGSANFVNNVAQMLDRG